MLPIESSASKNVPPPLSLRSDTIGIFAILGISGLAQFLTGSPASIASLVAPLISLLWASTLMAGGVVGLIGTLVPERWRIIGFALEATARVALGCGAFAYSVALIIALGWERAAFNILVFFGLGFMLLVGALQIVRWLRWQRLAVDVVMQTQQNEAVIRDDQRAQRKKGV